MPKLIEETEIRLNWSDIDKLAPKERQSDMVRSSGVHLSGVIRYVLTAAGLLTVEDADDEMPLRMAVGMAWEAFAVGLWPDMVWQPGECRLDGVIGSPDGITGDCLEEFKATWKSRLEKTETKGVRPPPKDIVKERIWMLQIGGYCKMMGLRRARMHVLWVNGTYRNSGPEYYTYLVEFTEQELERMWANMILPNRDKAKPEKH